MPALTSHDTIDPDMKRISSIITVMALMHGKTMWTQSWPSRRLMDALDKAKFVQRYQTETKILPIVRNVVTQKYISDANVDAFSPSVAISVCAAQR